MITHPPRGTLTIDVTVDVSFPIVEWNTVGVASIPDGDWNGDWNGGVDCMYMTERVNCAQKDSGCPEWSGGGNREREDCDFLFLGTGSIY